MGQIAMHPRAPGSQTAASRFNVDASLPCAIKIDVLGWRHLGALPGRINRTDLESVKV